MKERPILFSAPMVRAILEGRKTQTRRVVKPQAPATAHPWYIMASSHRADVGKWWFSKSKDHTSGTVLGPIRCPYGRAGDRLWVRETFALENCREAGWYEPPHKDGRPLRVHDDNPDWGRYWEQPHYAATDPAPELWYEDREDPGVRWTPSIHMPRWASRLTLEVTGVRVERLQDITRQDAKAEGFLPSPGNGLEYSNGRAFGNANEAFRDTWDSLNASRGHGWDANPWVWVVEFRRLP